MTNAEKLDLVFPDGIAPFSRNWLDAEYKAPTPKESLVVEDCISRADVNKIIDCPNFRQADKLIQIMNLPSVEPKAKTGHWCEQNDDYYDWYECSECGYGSEGEMQKSSEHDVRTKFCPNCGSLMRGVEDGNDD